ncbi:hypothetical protein WS86_20365 [Burkholderia savannae]|nr:hypothetical protein WS86_20365 [Burkholderia savannae]KVK83970.1 hypothetical protein WS91_05650 [Burkholderia sp. MSMB1498]
MRPFPDERAERTERRRRASCVRSADRAHTMGIAARMPADACDATTSRERAIPSRRTPRYIARRDLLCEIAS